MSLSLVGLMTSCDMDAPNQSTLDEPSLFSQYSLTEQEIMSIHVSFCETNSYRGRFLPFYGLNTDVEVPSASYPSYATALKNDDKMTLCTYSTLATNGQMNTDNNAYAKFYEGVERANLAIAGIRKYGNIESNRDMAQLLGEALTLRAVVYNDLIKGWGDVPYRFEPNNPTNVYLPRTNRDIIYKQLLADLKEAEGYCYWPNESQITKSTERVSKSFVKALRARIALYAGGYGLRGDGYRKSKDPELATDKMYEIAKEECLDVINSGRNTMGSFKENFTKLCQDNVTAGGESLWEIPFSDGRGRVVFTFGVEHQAKDQYTNQAQGGVNGPMPYLYYDYDVEDVRRDITCVPYEWSKDLVNGKSYQSLRGINKWCFGKVRYEWMKSDRALNLGKYDDGVNWQYMRMADVYLMAAEAINALDGPSAAWPYMKKILDRALPAEKVATLETKYCASKDAFFNGIVEQRGLEFAGESLRKADLVRWGIIDEKMAEAKEKLTRLANRTGEYSDLPSKLYYKLEADGETLNIYGLNHGDTDDEGTALTKNDDDKYSSKQWFVDSKSGENVINDDYINGLYIKQPSLNCLWPIWQTFINKSNGMLNNDGNYGQLSD